MSPCTAERITVVACRSWPIVGAGRSLDDLAITVAGNRVTAVSAAAARIGVHVGLRRREAQRRAPGVEVLSPDLAGEARAFEAVIRALEDLTPRIELDRPGSCAFLTRGPSRYFGGDQAMSERVAAAVAAALDGSTTVHVGTADSRFAAMRAATIAPADGARVVPPGASAAFLAPLPISVLASDLEPGPTLAAVTDLVDVLARLGLTTLGSFAALSPADVTARFGATGVRAHGWARGLDDRPTAPVDPPPELEVSIDLDPPVDRVDRAAFIAKAIADEFVGSLNRRGISCARVAVIADTEHGEQQLRLWRSEDAFTAAAIAERTRWQLDGWLSGPVRQRPTGGLIRLTLRPDDVGSAVGRQLGFWGEESEAAERASRAVARVQGLGGVGVAVVPELRGGRTPAERVAAVAAEAVDLVERAVGVDRTLIGGLDAQGKVSGAAAGAEAETARLRWPGGLPAPAPTRIHSPPIAAVLIDDKGDLVRIDARGVMAQSPAILQVNDRVFSVSAWSGPWLLDQRWWHADQRQRAGRLQVVLADGRALLLSISAGKWSIEATYD